MVSKPPPSLANNNVFVKDVATVYSGDGSDTPAKYVAKELVTEMVMEKVESEVTQLGCERKKGK